MNDPDLGISTLAPYPGRTWAENCPRYNRYMDSVALWLCDGMRQEIMR